MHVKSEFLVFTYFWNKICIKRFANVIFQYMDIIQEFSQIGEKQIFSYIENTLEARVLNVSRETIFFCVPPPPLKFEQNGAYGGWRI